MSKENEIIMKKLSGDFGERLEKLCKDRGISINELSRRIGVSSKTVHTWVGKNGSTPRRPDDLKKLCDFFGVSLEFLVFGEDRSENIEALFSKSEVHTGLYEITIKRVAKKDKGDNQ